MGMMTTTDDMRDDDDEHYDDNEYDDVHTWRQVMLLQLTSVRQSRSRKNVWVSASEKLFNWVIASLLRLWFAFGSSDSTRWDVLGSVGFFVRSISWKNAGLVL